MRFIDKIFGTNKDETLEFLEEMNKNFLNKIKDKYGFKSIEEYESVGKGLFNYQNNRSARYPVGCDC